MSGYLDASTLREYLDSEGTRWRRRGTLLQGRALERRTRRADVLVLHRHANGSRYVPADERNRFWNGVHERMALSEHSGVRGAEFKDDAGRHLVIIDESC
ncbi:MAG: hypothetical protein QOC82_688 [Frankiaceae bacterium]|nr:hypothetical protein [Frankiaceae bacterium]MDQ1699747.1 hypothetical protein [Frankiaceae bacterium]